MKRLVKAAFRAIGYELVAARSEYPPDITSDDRSILQRIAPYTMTSQERQIALIQAVRHIAATGVGGSFVECGVWKGGSMMAVALTLIQAGLPTKQLYLYDTYSGMTSPSSIDKTADGSSASAQLKKATHGTGIWCYSTLEEVKTNLAQTGYSSDHLHYIAGAVEETIPIQSPEGAIALLRLDTDWYESTKHELTHLYPQLARGGILIIDDYGYWQGAKQATDEFLSTLPERPYLHRIDSTGRLLIKP